MIATRSPQSFLRLARWGALVALAVPLSTSETRADAPPGRYVTTNDTVQDTQTGLTWQRAIPLDPCSVGSAICTWEQALSYCNTLSLAGGGWRLPDVKELQTLVDDTLRAGVAGAVSAIDPVAFPSTPGGIFWTSSALAGSSSFAWAVNFSNGSAGNDDVSDANRVRCVR